ncbi:MAG: prepilin-type N-terminal cleavage/methylation domain-containing protein, partial [Deltaproteobacteria bacterium]|nr:prepilin-type N-terminal cleavage/methylation domain-containing protein [Deltaproteobacteria bacterium]
MKRRKSQAGLTLIEVLIATAIMAAMMTLVWSTVSNTHTARTTFEAFEERNHEMRMALAKITADFESAYLSRNEDQNATNPRTMFIARPSSKAPEIRFSTLGHRVLWADANESEQTVISYVVLSDRENKGQVNWIRREQRRPSNLLPDDEPAEYDVLVHNLVSVKIEFWNWKNLEWQDSWDTTQADGQKGWLPSRVKITLTIKDATDKD